MHEKTKMQRTLQTWLRHTIIRNNKILPNEYFRNKIKCNRSKIDIIDEHTCFADRVYILPLFWVVPIQEIHNRAFRAKTLLMHSYNHQCRKVFWENAQFFISTTRVKRLGYKYTKFPPDGIKRTAQKETNIH